MEENNSIKVLDRALSLLEILGEQESYGVNELAKKCSLSPATTYRILRTLCAHGWAWQSEDEKYSAGVKMSYFSAQRTFLNHLREVAYYHMVKLTASENEAMNLVVRDIDKCYILGQSRTDKIVDYVPPIGTVLPFYASACGKVLLSELDAHTLDNILSALDYKKMTDSTVSCKEELLYILAKVRENGYAVDNHESQAEGFCIAVPIRSDNGEIIAALSFSGFIGKKTVDEVDYYAELLKKASKDISNELFKI